MGGGRGREGKARRGQVNVCSTTEEEGRFQKILKVGNLGEKKKTRREMNEWSGVQHKGGRGGVGGLATTVRPRGQKPS